MFQATGLFAFVRKMPNISTSGGGGGCFVCWCRIEGPQSARCSVWELRALSWHREMMCLINLHDNTGKMGPNLWFLNQALFLMDPLQMFSLLTGWHPAVTDGGHSGSNWTISGPSLCFSELRPQWSGLLFSFVLQRLLL